MASAVALALAGGAPSASSAARSATGSPERQAERLGLQAVPKHQPAAGASAMANRAAVNPMIGLLPDPSAGDYSYWRQAMKQASTARAKKLAAQRALAATAPPLVVDEAEPDTVRGGNDTNATAQAIPAFGTGSGKRPAARVLGTLAATPVRSFVAPAEDNGAIVLTAPSVLPGPGVRARTASTIGDGPHGSTGDGTGDFDVYPISGRAGQRLVADIDTGSSGALDSVLLLFDGTGELIAANDDTAAGLDSLLNFVLPAAGTYFLMVTGFLALPADPFDSGSGDGAQSEGDYALVLGLDASDVDVYAVNLRAGDVLGGSVTGSATLLSVRGPSGSELVGSGQDASFIYPPASPLPGGGNAVVAHVATVTGTHYIALLGGTGTYDLTLEAYRPGPQSAGVTQTIFLDFNGGRLNTNIFGGPGVRTLSPLSAFLGRWGLRANQENALIDRVVATVTENLRQDFAGTGVRVRILNSRDHADPFGGPNVSRLIVGGTIDESGIPTIGIAQSIDPGNFETEETALILLDVVSDPAFEDASFNFYFGPGTDKVRFIGTALGNIASHEAGHYLGSFHVDQFNEVLNLMDQGGNFPLLYGVGPDGVGGTADDPDVDFGRDTYNPNEGFTGIENTRANTRWALHS